MYISFKSNQNPTELKYFFLNWLVCCCTPLWALIAMFSKNLVFDAILYDVLLCVSCTVFSIYFAQQYHFNINTVQIIGIIIMIVGIIIFKIG